MLANTRTRIKARRYGFPRRRRWVPAPAPGAPSSARQAAAVASRTPRQRPAGACPQACGAEKSVSAIRRGGLRGAGDRPQPSLPRKRESRSRADPAVANGRGKSICAVRRATSWITACRPYFPVTSWCSDGRIGPATGRWRDNNATVIRTRPRFPAKTPLISIPRFQYTGSSSWWLSEKYWVSEPEHPIS
jgi:hypothetical protein